MNGVECDGARGVLLGVDLRVEVVAWFALSGAGTWVRQRHGPDVAALVGLTEGLEHSELRIRGNQGAQPLGQLLVVAIGVFVGVEANV